MLTNMPEELIKIAAERILTGSGKTIDLSDLRGVSMLVARVDLAPEEMETLRKQWDEVFPVRLLALNEDLTRPSEDKQGGLSDQNANIEIVRKNWKQEDSDA